MVDLSRLPDDLCSMVSGNFKGTSCTLQVTRMGCGGVIIGLSAFHCLVDGPSIGAFMGDWGRRTRAITDGLSPTPPLFSPSFDRSFMVNGMQDAYARCGAVSNIFAIAAAPPPPPASSSPPPAHVVGRVYHFPRAELEAMRKAASSEGASVTAYDALFAHMTQVICEATGTASDDSAMLCVPVNGRRLFSQPHFFGSAAFWMHRRSTYSDVLASLPRTASLIHRAHAETSAEGFLAYNGFLDSAPSFAHVVLTARITTHDLHAVSWRHSGMYDVDFGWGATTFTGPAQTGYGRYQIFHDAPKGSAGEGGIDVFLALEDAHWDALVKQDNLHRFAQTV